MKKWYFAVVLSTVLLVGCKEKKTDRSAFINYVESHTSGIISNSNFITVHLRADVPLSARIDPQSLFSFTPKIRGRAVIKDRRTFLFIPDAPLPSGQRYKGVFYLGKLIDVPRDQAEFDFEFQVIPLKVELNVSGLQSYLFGDDRWSMLSGGITTSDFIPAAEVESGLKATQEGRELSVRWIHNRSEKTHQFTIDSVRRTDVASEVVLRFETSKDRGDTLIVQRIPVPAINDFKLSNLRIVDQESQTMEAYFTKALDPKQDLKGLIYLESGEELKMLIKGNVVKIYPTTRLVGDKTVIFDGHIRSAKGKQLDSVYKHSVYFEVLKPQIRALTQGVIVPTTSGTIFPFEAVNLKAVRLTVVRIADANVHQFFQVNDWDGATELARVGRVILDRDIELTSESDIDYGKWNSFAIDLSELMEVQPGALYRIYLSFLPRHTLIDCPEEVSKPSVDRDFMPFLEYRVREQYFSYNDIAQTWHYYNYWSDRKNPCHIAYYANPDNYIVRNLFGSNLGIVVKKTENRAFDVFVRDLRTAEPAGTVRLQFYNYQGEIIYEDETDADGYLHVQLDKNPFFLVARRQNEYGYLRIDDASALSTSVFDVDGVKTKKGIKGFVYAERGVWRPGDSIFLQFILQDKDKTLPYNHPVILEVYTPENTLFLRRVNTESFHRFYDFRFAVPMEAKTGTWTAKIIVGDRQFSKELKIETIKPNRLKILFTPEDGTLLAMKNKPTIQLHAEWLHGGISPNLSARVEGIIMRSSTQFANFQDFIFEDLRKEFYQDMVYLYDDALDDKGNASITIDGFDTEGAPGLLNLYLHTKVFEPSGDFSIGRAHYRISPYREYIGFKLEGGESWWESLKTEVPVKVPVVIVDETGEFVKGTSKVAVRLYEVDYRWWWEYRSGSDHNYLREDYLQFVQGDTITVRGGRHDYTLRFPERLNGRIYLCFENLSSGHSSGKIVYVSSYGYEEADTDHEAAEILNFSTDKERYRVGEECIINLPAAEKARALISVENASRVLRHFWVNVSADQHQVRLPITKDMTPNVYLVVHFIQPYHHPDNDLPIRLYGIRRIYVEDKETKLEPVIEVPDEVRPLSEMVVRVSESSGKAMAYTLAVVDEGLLDLTNYQTPSPWETFYQAEALGVKTFDMYHYVLGAYEGKFMGVYAIGGDDALSAEGKDKLSRFKPVVRFIGPYYLKKGGENVHRIPMPNYIGSVRVMVVAADDETLAYGKGQRIVKVKNPLMILPTLPRSLSPFETVNVPVTVMVGDAHIKDVRVKMQYETTHFKGSGRQTKRVRFDRPGEKVIHFILETGDKVGFTTLSFTATSGAERSTDTTHLEIKLRNPPVAEFSMDEVAPGRQKTFVFNPLGAEGTNELKLTLSTYTNFDISRRLDYLIRYPYGCLEQTTSSGFPQLFLTEVMKLNEWQRAEIDRNIRATIARIALRQRYDGAFTLWPGCCLREWTNTYAGHFLLEAKKKGYYVSHEMLRKWLNYQERQANEWSLGKYWYDRDKYEEGEDYQKTLQAYRLFTLALAGRPQYGAMNRLRAMKDLPQLAKVLLACAYSETGKSYIAEQLLAPQQQIVFASYRDSYLTFGSEYRDRAMALYALVRMNRWGQAQALTQKVAEALSSNRHLTTHEISFSLLALSHVVRASKTSSIDVEIFDGSKTQHIKSADNKIVELKYTDFPLRLTITNLNDDPVYINFFSKGVPLYYDRKQPIENNLRVQLRYLDVEGKPLSLDTLRQNTDVVVEVTVENPNFRKIHNMALDFKVASGFEIRNTRMDAVEWFESSRYDYRDFRDDAVYVFFDIDSRSTANFYILLNATYKGTFYQPPVQCGGMYDLDVISILPGQWITIR